MMELGKGRQSKRLNGEERHESQRLGVKRRKLDNEQQQSSLSSSSSSSSSWSESGAVAAARSKFMSVVIDDILQEVLVRLPDSRSVIQCSFVCKRWFSLVSPSSQVGFDFIRKFNHHHRLRRYQKEDQEEQLPYSLLMKGCYHTSGFGPSYRSGSPSYHFLSDKFKILHYGNVSTFITAYGDAKREDDYLEFLLWPSNQGCIISSFDDLLLMRKRELEFYICNPLTSNGFCSPTFPSAILNLITFIIGVVLCASPIAPATPNFDNLDKLEEEEEDYLHLRLRTRLHLHPHITVIVASNTGLH